MSTTRATRIALCKQVSRGLDASTFVNNYGICLLGAVEETNAQEVERLFRTNVFGC